MVNAEWRGVKAPPPLHPGEIHVWRAAVETNGGPRHEAVLSAAERERLEKFRAPIDRQRYVTGRGVLRRLLGTYIGRPAHELQFDTTAAGKPFLVQPAGGIDIRCNVSHSGDFALLAFALGVEVGVDVEHCRREIDGLELAARFFAEEEVAELRAAGPDVRIERFYTCWTRKEACLKAVGEGLQIELRSFMVGGGEDFRQLTVPSASREHRHDVQVWSVPMPSGYRAAVAAAAAGPLQPLLLVGP